jgi:predicted enzyme related to lactoylglutathione lyase
MRMLLNIDVPELKPSIEFYCSAFGLKLCRLLDDDVAELIGGESRIYLLKNDIGSICVNGPTRYREYSRHWTPVHIDFVVEDIAQATKRVLNAGAIQESECIDWKGSKCVTFSDPFGHGFCLIEFEGESYSENIV